MTALHPTSQIDPNAHVDPTATLGPWSTVNGRASIESNAQLQQHTAIRGAVRIEAGVQIYPGARIGSDDSSESATDTNTPPTLIIHRNAVIRELAAIEHGTVDAPTIIGQDAYIMARTRIGASANIADTVTIANAVSIGAGASVANHVTIGGNTVIGDGVRIGRMAMLSGVITITKDIPPFCTAYLDETVGSLNLIGLRRAGLRQHIDGLRLAFQILYRSDLTPEQAVRQIETDPVLAANPLCTEITQFISESRLGITPYIGAESATDSDDSPKA